MSTRTFRFLPVIAIVAALAGLATAGGAESASAKPEQAGQAPIAGFVLDHGRYRTVAAPGAATFTLAFGINNGGAIVGSYDDADGRQHGFLRERGGRFRTIDEPGCYSTAATRINDRGQIVGDCWTTEERYEQGLKRGFLLDRGRFIRVNVPGSDSTEAVGVDNRGRVVGETATLEPLKGRGYLWVKGRITFIDVPGAIISGAAEINERGQIAGAGTFGDDPAQAVARGYLLDKGRYRTFTAPGGPLTVAFGLNNRGQIVGYVAADELLSDAHGFLLAEGVGGPFTPVDVPGALLTIALGINDHGQIVGGYENPAAATAARRTDTHPPSRLADLLPAG